jgi:ADP-ribose pyrophosphatase
MPTKLTLPAITLELLEDLSPPQADGFLRLVRRRYRAHYPDGATSEPFVLDAVHRRALDAVVIAAHFQRPEKGRSVYLRSAVRAPLLLREPWRDGPGSAQAAPAARCGIWELPAGLVELEELSSPNGIQAAARRELLEELGFDVALERLRQMGAGSYPTPGIIAEQNYYFEVEVDPAERKEPSLDGSALERSGVVVAVELAQAISMCASGQIPDAKSELALRRLEERLK